MLSPYQIAPAGIRFCKHLSFLLLFGVLMAGCGHPQEMPEVVAEPPIIETHPGFLITASGDTIPTGVPIPAKGRQIHPDSVAKPRTMPMGRPPRVVKIKNNTRPAGTPKSVKIPKNLTEITPGENGVPPPKTFMARGKDVPVIHTPSLPAGQPDLEVRGTHNFQSLNVQQGLDHSFVYSILKDKRGDLWFGGDHGVSRYDGTRFTHYEIEKGFSQNDKNISVLEDRQGRLWFGAYRGNGVTCYDGSRFTHYTTEGGLCDNSIRSILQDSLGRIWFGTDGGVCYYDPDTFEGQGSFTHYTTEVGLSNDWVQYILEDSQRKLWFGTWGGGLCHFDPFSGEYGTFTHYTTKEGLTGNTIRSIEEDIHGGVWIGTNRGVSRYTRDVDGEGHRFIHYTTEEGLIHNSVWSILEDRRGNLWFGTWGGGVSRFDGSNFTSFTTEDGLSHNIVYCMWEDKLDRIWFGTWSGGISWYNSGSFAHFSTDEGLGNNNIRSLMIDSRDNLWIGTLGGIHKYDDASFTHYWQDHGLIRGDIRSIMEDKQGNLWFGSRPGLSRINPVSSKGFTSYTEKEGLNHGEYWYINHQGARGDIWLGTRFNGITRLRLGDTKEYDDASFTHFTTKEGLISDTLDLMEDSCGRLWFATNKGATCFDPPTTIGENGTFTHYTTNEGLLHNKVNDIIEDRQGNFWFATEGGLNCYNGKSFVGYTTENGLSDNNIKRILEDGRGQLWIITGLGLCRYNGIDFIPYTVEKGLSDNQVVSIIEDNQENIWVATRRGINLLIPIFDESASNEKTKIEDYQLFSFDRNDGLEELKFLPYVQLDAQNRIWWGSNNGITMLDLNRFRLYLDTPKVRLNTININERFIDYRRLRDTSYQNSLTIGTALEETFDSVMPWYNYPLTMTLPHTLNHLSFQFSAIDWSAPHKLKYAYIMEGLEEDWSPLTSENKADYRNLPAGKFTFKVKAIGAAQIESNVFAYKFQILPPWWLSWWAYIIYGGLVFLLLYGIRNYEARRYRTQSENRRLRELDTFKTRLYTNITHEFRTPLTIILGMARQIKEDPKRWYNEGLTMITRSGRQLLSLVNQMLDLSKLDKGQLALKMQQAEVVSFLHYLVQSFESYAAGRNIQLHFLKETDRLEMDIDPDQLTKVMSNLLSNAIKYTPEEGQVYVMVDIQSSGGKPQAILRSTTNNLPASDTFLRIKVKDTGTGIPAEALPRIFDRFYQVDNSTTRKTGGTGLGLALAKELVQLMEGNIQVQSKVGEGTVFRILLPIRQSAPKAETARKTLGEKESFDDTFPLEVLTASGKTENIPFHPKAGTATANGDLPLVLLVEDNPDVLTYLAACLQAEYQLEFATNGQEGIEQALEIVPDIIISDLMMPEKDGYELCTILKNNERTSHIPIILLTSKADREAKLRGLKAGADAYLTKPFDREELFLRMQKLAELRQQLQARFGDLKPVPSRGKKQIAIENRFLKRLQETVEAHLSEEGFGITQLCREIGMSRSQLHNKLKALSGKSASIYIRSIRLEKAKALLINSDLNISEIAYAVGFRTPVYFTQVFTEMEGVSPSQFRDP